MNEFEAVLRENPNALNVAKRQEVMGIIGQYVSGINLYIGRSRCLVRTKHFTHFGIRYQIVLQPTCATDEGDDRGEVLFSIQVPASGYPVYVETLDRDSVRCPTAEELKDTLKRTLRRRETLEIIESSRL